MRERARLEEDGRPVIIARWRGKPFPKQSRQRETRKEGKKERGAGRISERLSALRSLERAPSKRELIRSPNEVNHRMVHLVMK